MSSNCSRSFARLLRALLVLGFPATSVADVMYDESIEKEFAAADLVVEAKVVGVVGRCIAGRCENSCYDVSVSKVIFDQANRQQEASFADIPICAQSGLALGDTYIFMLRRVKKIGADDPSTPVDEGAGRCTYFANFGATFLRYAADVYFRFGSPEASTLVRERAVQYLTIGKRQEGLVDELNRLATERNNARE
ncbi:MAG TPA: hypothetical protein VJ724_08940 [Tahibacter sp.]|nr:hypothetical protein [Tahibacter sp.]